MAWLEDIARRARARLRCFQAPAVVGHVDWYVGNLRWLDGRLDGRLHVVHDWDSLAALPEAIICGLAVSELAISLERWVQADLPVSERFLAGYERARGQPWSADEREAVWAAAVWLETYNIHPRRATSPSGWPSSSRSSTPACA